MTKIEKVRKKRKVFGSNFKWGEESNRVAFHLFNVEKFRSEYRPEVAKRLGIREQQLEGRIGHFKSLTPESKSTSVNPTAEVKALYNELCKLSKEESIKFLDHYINSKPELALEASSNADIEIEEDDLDFEEYEVENVKDLEQTYQDYWALQKEYQITDMSSLPLNEFLKIVSMMNIKSRGIKLEKRFIVKNKLRKAIRSEPGDAWLENGDGVEIKTSFITPLKGSSVSLTGLRFWEEDVKYYLLLVIDISDLSKDPVLYPMWVPKDALINEDVHFTTPNMKGEIAKANKNVPKGLCLNKATLEKWIKKYPLPKGYTL